MIETLGNLGIEEKYIKKSAKTGLVVDIWGKGEKVADADGKVNVIALRADMDGLQMAEDNPDLDYKSQTNFAHMCGHDGHMASLMAFT